MRRTYIFLIMFCVMAITAMTFGVSERRVRAQSPAPFQYAVKFVCGKSPSPGQPQVVASGNYFTAINVHNPTNEFAKFRKKIAVALPNEKPGRVSPFFDAGLKEDQALEIDCGDIYQHLEIRPSFLKGFVVIESRVELDVVAVYTAAGASGQIETMDIETIQPRRGTPQGSPDLLPVPDANGNFCRIDPNRRLIVTIKNQGAGNAGPSQTKVTFSNGTTATAPTPAIPAGGSVDVFVPIPANCFQPDCGFRISADAAGQVTESNELNNTASGSCLG